MRLPVLYSNLLPQEKREVRQHYKVLQRGLCHYCKQPLSKEPIKNKRINWGLFPRNFLKYSEHLHHNHNTDLTIGVVHAYCNAVLWQYHGE